MDTTEIVYPLLNVPGACAVTGVTFSGKTTLISQILLNKDLTFNEPTPKHIVYCHMNAPDAILHTIVDIHFHQGVPLESDIEHWIAEYSSQPWVLVFEDMQTDFLNSDIADKLLTRLTHHHNCFVFLVGHTLFSRGKNARLVSLNVHYFILTRSCRDVQQLMTFGTQLLGAGQGRKFLEACLDATELRTNQTPSYLFVNVHPLYCKRGQMLFTNILPSEAPLVLYKTA